MNKDKSIKFSINTTDNGTHSSFDDNDRPANELVIFLDEAIAVLERYKSTVILYEMGFKPKPITIKLKRIPPHEQFEVIEGSIRYGTEVCDYKDYVKCIIRLKNNHAIILSWKVKSEAGNFVNKYRADDLLRDDILKNETSILVQLNDKLIKGEHL